MIPDALQRLRDLPRYAFDQDGSIYGPVDAGPGTFIRDEDFTEVLATVREEPQDAEYLHQILDRFGVPRADNLALRIEELGCRAEGRTPEPPKERRLCSRCDGNGVVPIHHGTSVCPECHGDCWAVEARVPHEPPACANCADMQRAVTQMARENRSLEKRINELLAQASRPAPPLDWQPIATAPKGSWPDGPQDIRDPSYVEPPRLWLTLQDGLRCVGYFDAYYAEGGNAYDGEPPWVEVFSGERIRPTHWMPLPDPPAAVPQAAETESK